ncbi:MAG: MBOAT family protein, partial [Lachnospiraceae bacterium]|nr:MBOAT family protein [Lachnospiraceae bacterium]
MLFLLYYTVCRKVQWGLLLIAGYVFYYLANPLYLIYILITTLVIYLTGIAIQNISDKSKEYLASVKDEISKEDKKAYKAKVKKSQKRYLILCLVINFGILIISKYTNFFIMNINTLMGRDAVPFLSILLPLGISFYTLQACSYVIDVYRGSVQAERNPGKMALFVSFFPQLVQGPISRFDELAKDLYQAHPFDR